jgi:uncharacterized protein (TIGR03084 family)
LWHFFSGDRMIQQAQDFLEESERLYELLSPIGSSDFNRKSQFKGWTVNDVLRHLHFWNLAADLSLRDEQKFAAFIKNYLKRRETESIRSLEDEWFQGLEGKPLLHRWRDFYTEMTERFHGSDPKKRVKWAGPDMSVLSSITARQMETWAHGQELYDLLGVVRKEYDSIRNIVFLGNSTFAWAFLNRGLQVPGSVPFLRLTAPSGSLWEFNESSTTECITGEAAEFCQVVTQVRNVRDTLLQVVGETANSWMSIAQSFAGPPEDPPPPGSRFRGEGERK